MNATQIFALVAFILLAGARLVFDPLLPQPLPGLLGTAVRFTAIALSLLLGFRPSSLNWRLIAWAGLLFLTLPVLSAGAAGSVSGLTVLLVFTLIPAAVVFVQTQQSGEAMAGLGPALAGFAGASFLVPYSLPTSITGYLWLAAMLAGALLSGIALVQIAKYLQTDQVFEAAGQIALGTALMAGMFCAIGWQTPPPLALRLWPVEVTRLIVEGGLLLIATYLLAELGAVRYATRYLLVPLAGIAISFVLARPPLSWTVILGAMLMLGSSCILLRRGANT